MQPTLLHIFVGHEGHTQGVLQSNSPSSTRPLNEAFRERLAAKRIGLTIQPAVLALADKVIK